MPTHWLSKLSVVVVAGLLLAGVSGLAIAQSGGAAPKKIKACAKKKGGALRLGKKCRKGERRVTWAVKGPRGLTGLRGEAGMRHGGTGNMGHGGSPSAWGL